jgi:hypothetical protein
MTYRMASHSENFSASLRSYWIYVVLAFLFFVSATPFFLFFCGFVLDTTGFSFFDTMAGLNPFARGAVELRNRVEL